MTPTREDFIRMLKESLYLCENADDAGTVDFQMAWWQWWTKTWEPIFDEEGGI